MFNNLFQKPYVSGNQIDWETDIYYLHDPMSRNSQKRLEHEENQSKYRKADRKASESS